MANGGTILHLLGWDKKFVPTFIDFVVEHFATEDHRFIIHGEVSEGELPQGQNIIHYPRLLQSALSLMAEMRISQKIILHGLFSSHLLYLLMLQPWLLKKCYWAIWGGDLYVHEAKTKDWRWRKNELIRRFVISRIGHFITYIFGEYQLAQEWYGARGRWHECFTYPSNLYRSPSVIYHFNDGFNVLIGNSADPSNSHKEIIDRLEFFSGRNIKLYCPLSYGDQVYAQEIEAYGKLKFGEKFVALREFIPYDEYIKFLEKINVAVFNHNRQQGFGNIVTIVGFGKKVYLRSEVTTWAYLKDKGVEVFEITDLPSGLDEHFDGAANSIKIKNLFSDRVLIDGLSKIFDMNF